MNGFNMKIMVLGMNGTNCYIVFNDEIKEAIVFDPGDEADKIEQYLKANDLVCKGILLTHGHFDHILGVSELVGNTHAKVYAHEAEAELLKKPELNVSSKLQRGCSLVADVWLKDQEEITIAGYQIRVIHTPGHTVGGACYYFHGYGILISGDTLFRENIGRYDLPTGNGEVLISSILNKLMILEDQVKVYPGHGQSTTIGYERNHNFYLT